MFNIYIGIGEYTYLWTSTEESEKSAFDIKLSQYNEGVFCHNSWKYCGLYIRCLKDK